MSVTLSIMDKLEHCYCGAKRIGIMEGVYYYACGSSARKTPDGRYRVKSSVRCIVARLGYLENAHALQVLAVGLLCLFLLPWPVPAKPMAAAINTGAHQLADIVIHEAVLHGVPSHLAIAVAQRESGITTPKHASPTGDWGVMQLSARWYPGAEHFTPEQNAHRSMLTLAQYWDRCAGDVGRIWRAYNRGPWVLAGCRRQQ
jgi:soluble lytic murein transglycosylase-like protein